jgi:hypothetical protein
LARGNPDIPRGLFGPDVDDLIRRLLGNGSFEDLIRIREALFKRNSGK